MGIYGEIVVGAELFRCANFFEIILYRDLEGVGIADAYEQGWISVEDLFTLAKRFYQFQLENAEDPDAVRQLYGDYAARYESP